MPMLLIFAAVICTLPSKAAADVLRAKHVLILHSYHPGLPWTDQLMSGMQAALAQSKQRINVDVEYLDTKRHRDSEYFTHILDAILHYKFKDRSYDLVLVSDNEALNFAQEHNKDLFRNTPIVFCGINKENPALLNKASRITGVMSDPDFVGVVRQALTFHPNTKKAIVIGSTQELTDRINFQRLRSITEKCNRGIEFTFWNDLPAEKLQSQLGKLGRGSIILINGSIRDHSGNLLSFNEQTLLLRQATNLPMYSFWDVYLGEGIVGGPLLSAKKQGEQAAELALRILHGEPIGSLPVLLSAVDIPAFDFKELKRLGIPLHHLPEKHQLINEPPSSYQLTKSQFWLAACILIGSLSISILLTLNIIRRKRAEALLRESEQNYKQLAQQFQIILDGIPDGLTLISQNMKVVWSNKGAGNYFNKTLNSIPGEYCCKLLYNRTSFCDNCPAVNAFESGTNEESIINTPDGRILEVKAFPVKSTGEITHVIMLASDVTEKHRLIEENIRTRRLASLGELAAGIAHEINNPNALILLNSELLRKCCGDVAPILQRHYMQHGEFMLAGFAYSEMHGELPHLFTEMFESAHRIKRIVNDLKDFARPEDQDMMEEIDLNVATMASIRLVGNAVKNATDNFKADLAESLPPFFGNLQRIEQVVVNLLMNACQSLPDKSRGVFISTSYNAERQACVIKIRDEGVGISKENLPHITDPFFTTKRNNGGTGLGLSVSMRIIKDHGGDLEFYSSLNEGTTVYLYLPIKQEVISR